MNKKIMYRIWEDANCVGEPYRYFVIKNLDDIESELAGWAEDVLCGGDGFPVIEPFFMTDEEFENLPEFDGY